MLLQQTAISLAVLGILATFSWEDYKHLSISPRHATLGEVALIFLLIGQVFLSPLFAAFQVLIGAAAFLLLFKPLKEILAPFDRTIIFLTLLVATVPSLLALGIYLLYHSLRASQLKRNRIRARLFPAMAHYAIAFAVALLIMLF